MARLSLRWVTVLAMVWCVAGSGRSFAGIHVVADGYAARYTADVQRLAVTAGNRAYERLGRNLTGDLTLTIAPDAATFRRLTEGTLPEWTEAVAIGGNTIVVAPIAGRATGLGRVLTHEVAHIVITEAARDEFVPRWFHEGCAQYCAGEWDTRDRMLMTWSVVRGREMSFAAIEEVLSGGRSEASLAYDEAMLAVRHLIARNGAGAISAILDSLSTERSFPDAFHAAAGVWPSEFETDFAAMLKESYGVGSLYLLIPSLWTLMTILFIIVYVIKRRRTKRTLAAWDVIEAAENIIRFPGPDMPPPLPPRTPPFDDDEDEEFPGSL